MTKEPLTKTRTDELHFMAQGLYSTIVSLTNDPFEMVTVISMIHLMLWLNCREPNVNTEAMLKDYCNNFLENFHANTETLQ